MISSFTCSYRGIHLCFGNSSCATSGRQCICEPGYINDEFAFHSKNCAVPEILPWIFAGVFSVLWAIIAIDLVMKIKKVQSSQMRKFAGVVLLFHLFLEFFVIALAAEKGMYEASYFFCCSYFFLFSTVFQQMLILTLKLKYRGVSDSNKLEKAFQTFLSFEGVTEFALLIAGMN